MTDSNPEARGFTLIELSIVLVIIGLIVGGVLAGQSLISAASVRAQISQIEKYNSAVNTFQGKYAALPGDLNAATASQFGFTARGRFAGEGDGNGVIEGVLSNSSGGNHGYAQGAGETVLFWEDLSTANGQNVNLIDGSFSRATAMNPGSGYRSASSFFPAAKIGGSNYLYVWSGGYSQGDGINYYGLSGGIQMGITIISSPSMTIQQAYAIDKKMDDGLPQTGGVLALYVNGIPAWVGGDGGPSDTTTASPPSATTCYDDGGTTGTTRSYSVSQNGGAGSNCALSFRFQ